ncbi:phosphogluconate dehydrogenase (NAD(+)-dependent, decarboxylating), partial [Jatrophihabitans endophyticus]|uniref:phosphogluconate dehydrogenase (NAD(+)-dependent, decarboxylating) n=1 Tax=Jatrophihabitans endophyticus TaxID=1206085 RepID=UPI001A0438BD
MQLGMIGLGRMGANIVRRIVRDGHTAIAYDTNGDVVDELAKEDGITGAKTLEEFVQKLEKPRVAWVMIPAGITDKVVEQLSELLDEGDIIINGGNSNYREDYDRAAALKKNQNIEYLDCGTSGGVWGLERGYCLMIGGDEKAFQHCEPLFASIAPGVGDVERTAGYSGDPAPEEQGYLHCGQAGAGHFVKMVHNGIEYGMMAAYAEGLNVLHKANSGNKEQTHSAEETPLEQPQYYQYDLDLPKVAEVWRRGSVIASWLLDLTAGALHGDPELKSVAGRVSDSGEGRWTIKAGIDEGVPTPVLAASLFARFSSRGEAVYADKLLSAMRKAFGGHNELP